MRDFLRERARSNPAKNNNPWFTNIKSNTKISRGIYVLNGILDLLKKTLSIISKYFEAVDSDVNKDQTSET